MFRIVPAEAFLANFASDRSHMLAEAVKSAGLHAPSEVLYVSPPPRYETLCGVGAKARGVRHNLMSSFVNMAARGEDAFGEVQDLAHFAAWG